MIDSLAKFVVKRRLIILILFILCTAFFLYHALKVPVKTFFPDLIPSHPYSLLAKDFESFGMSNRVLVMLAVKEGDIFETKTLARIIDISNSLQFIPGVDRNKVYSIGVNKVKNFKVSSWGLEFPSLMYPDAPKTQDEIDYLKHNIYHNTLYYGRLVSLDSKAALISAEFFPEDLDYGAIYKALEEIRSKNAGANIEIYIEGDPYLYGVISHYMNETVLIFGVTLLSMILVCFWFTRLLRLVFVPLASMLFCGIWGMGCMNLLGFNLDPLVLVIPVLVSARALSHSLQFSWRIHEEYISCGDIKTACRQTIRSMMFPGLAGVITDGIGILLIAFIPIPVMGKIGVAFFIWALSVIFVVLIFNPVIYLYLPPLRRAKEWRDARKQSYLERKVLNKCFELGQGRRYWAIIGIVIVLAMGAGYFSLGLNVGDIQPGTPLLKQEAGYNRDARTITSFFPGLMDPLMIVIDSKEREGIVSKHLMKDMAKLQLNLMTIPGVLGTSSILDLLENLNMKLYEDSPKMYRVPGTKKGIFTTLFFLNSGGAEPGDFDPYYNFSYSACNVVAFLRDHTSATVQNVLDRCKELLARITPEEGYEFRLAAGRIGNVAATNESVAKNQELILIAAFVATAFFCAVFFRSVVAGCLLILPLGLANLFTFAYMALASIGVNLQTLPVSTIAIGIGVDYGIYLLSRIKEEYGRLGDLEGAIKEAINTCGNAVSVTGLIVICGVVFWNFSSIKFQADMGLLLAIVTFFHILGTLFFIPALVRFFRPRFILKTYHK